MEGAAASEVEEDPTKNEGTRVEQVSEASGGGDDEDMGAIRDAEDESDGDGGVAVVSAIYPVEDGFWRDELFAEALRSLRKELQFSVALWS